MISEGKINFIWVTIITTDVQLVKGHIRDWTRLIFGKNKGHVSRCPLKTRFGPNRVAADTEGN